MHVPTAREVKEMRLASGLSVKAAAAKVYMSARMWGKYEAGDSSMHPSTAELFMLKTAQVTVAEIIKGKA